MATIVNKTVAPSGDYTTLSAWEAAQQGDLVAADEIRQAECFAFQDTQQLTIDGSVTDSTRYLRVYATPGAEARMPFNTSSSYRLVTSQSSLSVQDPYTRIERIQIELTEPTSPRNGLLLGSGGCRAVGVIVRNTGAGAANCIGTNHQNTDTGICYLINCVAIGNNSTGTGFLISTNGAASTYLYNCTGVLHATGFNRTAGNAIAKNCLGHGCVTNDFAGTYTSSEYNASEDATAPGTNSRTSQTFTFVNAAGGDYHLASGDGGARNFGISLASDANFPFNYDFDNEARPASGWDIGADEIPEATNVIVLPSRGVLVAGGFSGRRSRRFR